MCWYNNRKISSVDTLVPPTADISIIEKNIDLDHELCQCKCMKKFDAYMEARNVTNMFVYNWNSIVKNAINKCQSYNGWNINEFLFISLILSD